MQLPSFDHTRQKWDDYSLFHFDHGTFVQFASGELICTTGAPKPDQRRKYRAFNVSLVATTGDNCPNLYDDKGDLVPKAWLKEGGLQHLAIDHDRKMAVRLHPATRYGRYYTHRDGPPETILRSHKGIPNHLIGRAAVYWGGPHAEPQGEPITISPPLVLTKQQKADLQSLIDSIHAWLALKDVEVDGWAFNVQIDGKQVAVPGGPPETIRYYLGKTMADMSYEQRLKLVTRGYMSAREVHRVPFLTIKD